MDQDQVDKYYSGCLYDKHNFWRFLPAKVFLSRVSIADEYLDSLRKLSQEGLIVYALKQRSKLNSLIIYELTGRKELPRPVYSHGTNMSFWQPMPKLLKFFWYSFLRRFSDKQKALQSKLDFMERTFTERKSSIIHLGESEFIESRSADQAIASLIKIQKMVDFPIFIVPVLVAYGRRRENENESLFNILFGQSEQTGFFRKIITFIRYSNKAYVVPAEPIKLSVYIEENKDRTKESIIHDLRGELIGRIEEEKAAIVGPALKSKQELIGMVLSDENMKKFIADYALKSNKDKAVVEKEARRYLYEIAADYKETFIEIWVKVLTWLWNTVYDGVVIDHEGMTKLRNVSKKMPFVIIPCHRSHIDYLLLSYVFFKSNIQMPFILAGINMSFFPMGYIFRKSGAFFMRRSFKGNDVYAQVLYKYLAILLQEGLPLEFFIEGGRSRTGKMVIPKYGLLAMLIQAYQERYCDNFAAIPVYIGYDRVIEEKSYIDELSGVPKAKENAAQMIKSGSVLRKRYGQVYINIGEPIIMKSYLESQDKQIEQMTVEERQGLYRKIGYEIEMEINNISVVTPLSLVAAGLLSHDRRGISYDELSGILNEFYEYLATRKVKFAATFAHRERAAIDALDIFVQSQIISKMEAEEEDEELQEIIYSLDDKKRLNLEYYKNTILHFFVPLSFVATSMLESKEDVISLSRILGDYKFLKRLLWNEFIFDERINDIDEVNDVLAYLLNRKMISTTQRDDQVWIELKGKGRIKLKHFGGLIHNYIEAYWVVIKSFPYLKKKAQNQKEWLKKILDLGDRMFKRGEVLRSEALSQANYQNMIKFLEDAELINSVVKEEKGGKKETFCSLTENRAEREVLRRRIFKFL